MGKVRGVGVREMRMRGWPKWGPWGGDGEERNGRLMREGEGWREVWRLRENGGKKHRVMGGGKRVGVDWEGGRRGGWVKRGFGMRGEWFSRAGEGGW